MFTYFNFQYSGGSSAILGNFETLKLIRKWRDFECSSTRCDLDLKYTLGEGVWYDVFLERWQLCWANSQISKL